MGKIFLSILLAFWMAGCTTDEGTGGFDVKKAPQKEKRTKYRTFISDEELKTKEEIAKIEAQKRIELEKIGSEARIRELELQKEKELALLREKERLLAIEHEQAMQRYMLIGGILLLLLAGATLLWYIDRRRKDKLRAYEDNLKKYFSQKENEARVKIAEKILDTVASQDLGIEQKTKLIEALHGPVSNTQTTGEEKGESRPRLDTPHDDEETIVIEPQENDDDTERTK